MPHLLHVNAVRSPGFLKTGVADTLQIMFRFQIISVNTGRELSVLQQLGNADVTLLDSAIPKP